MTSIQVDFNNRGPNGTVLGSLRRAGKVRVGSRVKLVDPDEEMIFDAEVVSIEGTVVQYKVAWKAPEIWPSKVGTATIGNKVKQVTAAFRAASRPIGGNSIHA